MTQLCAKNTVLVLAVCGANQQIRQCITQHFSPTQFSCIEIKTVTQLEASFEKINLFIVAEDYLDLEVLQNKISQDKNTVLKGIYNFNKKKFHQKAHYLIIEADSLFDENQFLQQLHMMLSFIKREQLFHREAQQLLQYQELILAEQTIAKNIFESFIQTNLINYPELDFMLLPLSTYNGDVLLAYKDDNNLLSLMLGDFTGHGLPAAIGSIPTAEVFYSMCKKQMSLAHIVREINRKLKKLLPTEMFCAACILSFDANTGKLKLWQGGLPCGYLIDESIDNVMRIDAQHLPLGVLSEDDFDDSLQCFNINSSMSLTMFTDGLIEMKNQNNECLLQSDILNCLIHNTDQSKVTKLKDLMSLHSEQVDMLDDVAIFSLQLNPTNTSL